ncbi:hypothetical protein Tco_1360983 [Tanacetum coccineum]
MASDDIEQTVDDMANDANQPPDDSTQTKDKDPKKDWFKQPPRPPNPDPEWNKCQVVDDQPDQPWFNNMVSAVKDPLTFNKLMATPIDFSKYAMNRLKIDNLTQAHLVGPVYELLKGTCSSNIKLEYNMEEYNTSITKTKAARYEIVGIEDIVPMLWSTTKVGYNKDAEKGIKHWCKSQETAWLWSLGRECSEKNKFKEGDFVGLHLNDIEDMLLLTV